MKHSVKAKKHLGQHFLNDANIANNIAQALLEKDANTRIIEIGPGTGILTQFLIEKNDFLALDIDEESILYLKETYPTHADKILLADFLMTDLPKLAGEKFNVIGNFPYNISSQIMFKVIDYRDHIDFVVGMFQKEVAQRLAEGPGSKVYGILSVLLQAYYDIDYLFTVNANVFTPPPKVQSAVIRLRRNNVKKLDCNDVLFKVIVKMSFNQRRKTIRNSIRGIFNNNDIRHPLLDKRPEQLSVAEFVALTNFVEENGIKENT